MILLVSEKTELTEIMTYSQYETSLRMNGIFIIQSRDLILD